jgi:uncharacterized damage-inducible protein DinB
MWLESPSMTHEEFLHHFEQVRGRTMNLARCIPANKVEWRPEQAETSKPPHAGTAYGAAAEESGRFTLGGLARHIAATERLVFAEGACGRPSRYVGCGRELADGREAVLAYMETMHAESMAIFNAFTEEQWNGKGKSPDGHAITAWKLLRAMIEHEIHHRGQMYVYLGILGVEVPSLFGTNEAELKRLSHLGAKSE